MGPSVLFSVQETSKLFFVVITHMFKTWYIEISLKNTGVLLQDKPKLYNGQPVLVMPCKLNWIFKYWIPLLWNGKRVSWFFGQLHIKSRCANKTSGFRQEISFCADLGPADPVCNYFIRLTTCWPQISILQPYTCTEVNVEKSGQPLLKKK